MSEEAWPTGPCASCGAPGTEAETIVADDLKVPPVRVFLCRNMDCAVKQVKIQRELYAQKRAKGAT